MRVSNTLYFTISLKIPLQSESSTILGNFSFLTNHTQMISLKLITHLPTQPGTNTNKHITAASGQTQFSICCSVVTPGQSCFPDNPSQLHGREQDIGFSDGELPCVSLNCEFSSGAWGGTRLCARGGKAALLAEQFGKWVWIKWGLACHPNGVNSFV